MIRFEPFSEAVQASEKGVPFERAPGILQEPANISIRDVCVTFGSGNAVTQALDHVSFDVGAGEFVAIVGASGCGKSTLLKVVAGLLRSSRGTVVMSGPEAQRTRVGFVFQSDALLPWRSALQNVELAIQLGGQSGIKSRERATELMNDLGLGDSCDKYPNQLSGGMRKRVALARALAYEPAVLLMDEPFGALDAQTRIHVGNFFLRLLDAMKQTVIFVTHDIDEAVALADRVVVLTSRPGRVAAIFDIPLPRPRDYHESRFVPGFKELQQKVWDSLGYGSTTSRSS